MNIRLGLRLAVVATLLGAPLGAASFSVSPQLPSSEDALRITVVGYFSGCVLGITPTVDGATVRLTATYSGIITCPLGGDTIFVADMPPLAAGTYRFQLEDRHVALASQAVTVEPPATELAMLGGRFTARLAFRTGSEADATDARAVPLTGQSGYFWFYGPLNPEVTLKVLDGRGVNGHFWVFVSGLTDRPFTLAVRDDGSGCAGPSCAPERTYTGTAGQLATIVDLAAF